MTTQDKYIQALIDLHVGLDRQGPGDPAFTEFILGNLPALPANPRIADIGCGAGAGALILAERFRSTVRAVDFSREFLDQLSARAKQQGLSELIEIIECDMAKLDWEPGSVDLLWSEGAAYNMTFEGALKSWRPLIAANGIAVISEMNYFMDSAPAIVTEFMSEAYPGIKTELQNVALFNASGFEVLGVHRLPSQAWWDNYYDPLREKIRALKDTGDEVMQAVIRDTEREMQLFAQYHEDYGYTFYIARAI